MAYPPKVGKLSDSAKNLSLNKIAGANFHIRSQFDFARLVADPSHIAANLRNHINGYSASAREIIEYCNFDDQIERMDDPKADILFQMVKKFAEIDLSDMETMEMGYVFEDLIRFAEQSNETAGEYFTPLSALKIKIPHIFFEIPFWFPDNLKVMRQAGPFALKSNPILKLRDCGGPCIF